MAQRGKKRQHPDPAPTRQPPKRKTKSKLNASKQDTTTAEPARFEKSKNPHATLWGLPVELRLEIYSYLRGTPIVHVHRHIQYRGKTRYTWTPCRAASPLSPLLCANPKWSGMCEEKDRCTHKINAPPVPTGFWALAAANKAFRSEAQDCFYRNSVYSVHPFDLKPWLNYLEKYHPRQMGNLRRITIAGPNYESSSYDRLQMVRRRVPKLEGLGFQCQDYHWRWRQGYPNLDRQINLEDCRQLDLIKWMREFDDSVTVAVEAMVWQKCKASSPVGLIDQQIAIRILREGKPAEDGGEPGAHVAWTKKDIKIEINQPSKVVASAKNAYWRQWWKERFE